LATPFRAVAKSEVHARQVGGSRWIGFGTNEIVDPGAASVATAEGKEVRLAIRAAPPPATIGVPGGPILDLWTEPELHTALPEVDHRARHVRVAMLVDADRIGVGQT
jgi:hypothetical protein